MKDDFSISDVEELMDCIGFSDRTEHDGSVTELSKLDFTDKEQARFAIRKWLVPAFTSGRGRTPVGRDRTRRALQIVISRWGFVPHGPGFPGIEQDAPPYRSPEQTYQLLRSLYLIVWEELFEEPLKFIQSTDSLDERDDDGFVNSPNNPADWGQPHYQPLDKWDGLLRAGSWRADWPPQRNIST